MEVSIEPHQGAAIFRLGECHVLVVFDAEWQVDEKIDLA
jgi:hypothetical protein